MTALYPHFHGRGTSRYGSYNLRQILTNSIQLRNNHVTQTYDKGFGDQVMI